MVNSLHYEPYLVYTPELIMVTEIREYPAQKRGLIKLSESGIRQKDRERYTKLSPAGSANYQKEYMGLGENGIAADDFNAFAALIYRLKDTGKVKRHIDVGTGPNLHMAIATAPHVDEIVTIDHSPANVNFVNSIVKGDEPFPEYLQSWAELAEIIYDIGDADSLKIFSIQHSDLYDALRHWCKLKDNVKEDVRKELYKDNRLSKSEKNPYRHIDIETELKMKVNARQGDLLEDIDTIADLVGTGNITTMSFVAESISADPRVVAHGIRNAMQLGRGGGIWFSTHMAETTGYKGFFTPEEARIVDKLEELPATQEYFRFLLSQCLDLDTRNDVLWRGLGDIPDSQKMVRSEPYGGVVILSGVIDDRGFGNGQELLRKIKFNTRVITVRSVDNNNIQRKRIMHCVDNETHDVVKKLKEQAIRNTERVVSETVTIVL